MPGEPSAGGSPGGDACASPSASNPAPAYGAPDPARLNIPDHQLLRCIGRGSYGEVWLARNVMGTYRAVKIVRRTTFDSERPYAREFEGLQKFEPISRSHESQVDILQVGRNDSAGYFYHVMELADDRRTGQKIDPATYEPKSLRSELKARGRLPFDEVLKLGLALTTALDHLHRHGLIHRDIKPSNIIFVNGLPKLADIGLVATVDATCSFVGTEGYLPPEGPGTPQADLYSLGKVLYEASTGMDRRDFPELPTHLEPPDEERRVLELNAVVVKACHPEARQRYVSAGQLHDDLLLLLAGRSVRRTHAMERRLRLMTQMGAAAVAIMLLGAVPYYIAIKEARRANALAAREAEARRQAEASERHARVEALKSQQVSRFLQTLLEGVKPSIALGRDTTLLREALDKTAERLNDPSALQPEAEADVRLILCTIYDELGLYTNAQAMARAAVRLRQAHFGQGTIPVADALASLGAVAYDLGNFRLAEEVERQGLEIRRRLLGNSHTNVSTLLNNLGLVLWNQGRLADAESMEREALAIRRQALGEVSLDVGKTLNNLANILWLRGDLAGAEELYGEAMRVFDQLLPREHPIPALLRNNLALILSRRGDLESAETLHQEALAMRWKLLGEHPDTAESLTQLGLVQLARGNLSGAESSLREAEAIENKLKLDEHPYVAETCWALGLLLEQRGDFEQAEALQRNGLTMRRKLLGDDNADVADSLNALGLLRAVRGDLAEAEPLLCEALEANRDGRQTQHPSVVPQLRHWAWAQQQQGNAAAADALADEACQIARFRGGYGACAMISGLERLAQLLQVQGRFHDAEGLLLEAAQWDDPAKPNAPMHRGALERLVHCYQAWEQAEPGNDKKAQADLWQRRLARLDTGVPGN